MAGLMTAPPHETATRTRPDTAACHERAVLRAIAAMRDHLDEELSLRELADVAIMSPFHFSRTFHHVIGMPPRRYLSALRLDRARHLLLTTAERITDVCFDVGYNSLGTFTRRFTEMIGVSPRALRGSARLEQNAATYDSAREPGPAGAHDTRDLSGVVTAPSGFVGLTFVGLFATAIPQGAPVACRILAAPGPFSIKAPRGRWHLYALGIGRPMRPLDLLLFDDALRASAGIVDVSPDARIDPVALHLRPRSDLDPPILLALPTLMARRQREMARAVPVAGSEAVA